MSSYNIKNKVDGDQLDLSMMSLKDVPLREIASVPRATTLDLSSNLLKSLPPSFGSQLSHLIKLDLSANKLQALPKSFHLLVNLKHLDLYNNQLTDLPVSLHHLTRLRFLDIENNPLEPKLQLIVGNCLTRKECEVAAKKLIAHFTEQKQFAIEEEIMAIKQKEAREQQLREEADANRLKNEKKAAKKERKNDNKQQKQQQQLLEQQQQRQASQAQSSAKAANGSAPKLQKRLSKGSSSKSSSWCSCMGWLNALLFACIAAAAGWCLHLHIEGDYSKAGLEAALPRFQKSVMRLQNLTVEALQPENLRKTGSLVAVSANSTAYEAAAAVQRAAYASQAYLEVYTGDLTPYTSAVSRGWSKAYMWASEQASVAGRWLMKQDWQGMWDACVAGLSAAATKLQEWWAAALKNPTVASLWDGLCLYTSRAVAWAREALLLSLAYLQENGPVWLALVRDNTYSAVLSVKESVQALIK